MGGAGNRILCNGSLALLGDEGAGAGDTWDRLELPCLGVEEPWSLFSHPLPSLPLRDSPWVSRGPKRPCPWFVLPCPLRLPGNLVMTPAIPHPSLMSHGLLCLGQGVYKKGVCVFSVK